jgi:hypothetical protein
MLKFLGKLFNRDRTVHSEPIDTKNKGQLFNIHFLKAKF